MPRKDINYSNTVMYKIVSNDLNILDCYVGSTTDFTKRKCCHKSNCANINSKNYNYKVYKFIRDNGDWHNWSMILIEMYPCTNHLESLQRERFWCENLNATLNSVVPSRSPKEQNKQYCVLNKEKIKEHKHMYYKQNKEKLKVNRKKYYDENKEDSKKYYVENRESFSEKHDCECGCSYTKSNKSNHLKTKKHQEYEKNRLYYDIRSGLDLIKKLDNYFKV
jgi:hypothetical protein